MNHKAVRTLLLAASLVVAATDARAADPDLETPQRALRFFVDSARAREFTAAAKALDLGDIPPEHRATAGPGLARRLMLVLDQERWLDWDKLHDEPGGAGDATEVIGTIPLGATPVSIRLVRSADGDWRLGRSVVAAIPRLYREYGPGWLGERLPPVLTDYGFLDLAAWQWLGLALGLALALFVGLVLGTLASRLAMWISRRTRATWDDRFVEALSGPFQLVLGLAVFAGAVEGVHLGVPAQEVLNLLLRIAAVIAFCWVTLRVIRFAADVLGDRLTQQGDGAIARSHLTQIALFRRIAGLIVVVLGGALVLMQFSGLRAVGTSLLASAGVAGIVIGLAAQRPMASLLAGLQVSLTQPVRIGDVVVIEGEWGTIEEITLTYVVVKIWDLRRLIVPITKVLDAPFQNWTRSGSDIIGSVFLHADYRLPVAEVRSELERYLPTRPEWDRKTMVLQVTNVTDRTVELRVLVSAMNAPTLWDLRCLVREHLMGFLQQLDGGVYLPRLRVEPPAPDPGDLSVKR